MTKFTIRKSASREERSINLTDTQLGVLSGAAQPKLTSSDAVSRKRTGPTSPPTKLTKMQRMVLSRAAQRQDGAASLPDGIKDKSAHKLAVTLTEKGLVREMRAKPGMPVWWTSEEQGSRSLAITKLGRTAIGVWGKDETNGVEGLSSNSPNKQATSATLRSKGNATPRPGSKLAEVIELLTRKEGARIAELTAATGWLAHTTRATLTGLRKRGYEIELERAGKREASIYRIVTSRARANAA